MRCWFYLACALGVCGVTFGAETAPTNVYVSVSGAGDLSGRDWENATNNLTGAYAICASNALGGTVHVAGGIYRSTGWNAAKGNFTVNAGVVPASNVALVGSDDPENPTILTGDRGLDNKWTNGQKQWSDGKLVEPPEGVYVRAANATQGSNETDSHFCASSRSVVNCRFENLTFHGFVDYALSIANMTNLVVSGCRFISSGTDDAHHGSFCLGLTESPAVVTNCTFVGYRVGIDAGAENATALTVVNCLFRSAYCTGAYTGGTPGVGLHKAVAATIAGCTFRWLRSNHPPALYLSYQYGLGRCTQSAILSNCVFRSCRGDYVDGTCDMLNGGTVYGCAFVSNSILSSCGSYHSSACIDGEGSFDVINSFFCGNRLTKTAGANCDASVLATSTVHTYRFVNCTAEDNCVTGATGNACTVGGWRPDLILLANCVFRNNDNWNSNGTRGREIKENCFQSHCPTLVNTIFWHPSDDYVPFRYYTGSESYEKRSGFAHCDIKNYTPPTMDAKNNGFAIEVLHDEPFYADSYTLVGSRGARRLAVRTSGAVRRHAAKLCRATNGAFYFLDTTARPNVWRKLGQTNDSDAKLSLAAGLECGLDPDGLAYPDVFDEPRRRRASFGPVDAPVSGALISVR